MKCAGTLQVVVPWLRGPDRFMQLMAAEMMLQIAKDENSFDAIITAGICRLGSTVVLNAFVTCRQPQAAQ